MWLCLKTQKKQRRSSQKIGQWREGPWQSSRQTVAAASELCTRMVLIEKLTEQVKVCRVHMVRQ